METMLLAKIEETYYDLDEFEIWIIPLMAAATAFAAAANAPAAPTQQTVIINVAHG